MAMMQGTENVLWFLATIAFSVLACLFTWFVVITGRDRPRKKQKRGESTIVAYGDIEEDRSPLSKFLIYTYAGVGVWSIVYLIWTGVKGLY